MSTLLTLSGVETHIGRYHILQGVAFGVPEGQTTMLLGRNGAGKTTTLRTIMGLWRASSGEIKLAGERIEALGTPDIARAGIGYVPETMAVFSDLTVRENLVLAARLERPDQVEDDRHLVDAHAGGRLVEHVDVGVERHQQSHFELALVAVRKLGGVDVASSR